MRTSRSILEIGVCTNNSKLRDNDANGHLPHARIGTYPQSSAPKFFGWEKVRDDNRHVRLLSLNRCLSQPVDHCCRLSKLEQLPDWEDRICASRLMSSIESHRTFILMYRVRLGINVGCLVERTKPGRHPPRNLCNRCSCSCSCRIKTLPLL